MTDAMRRPARLLLSLVLVACTGASGMQMTPPTPDDDSGGFSGLDTPGVVAHGVPCFQEGGPCPAAFHIDHDAYTPTVTADCQPAALCVLSQIPLPPAGAFSNMNFTCIATQPSGQAPEALSGVDDSTSSFHFAFYNQSGADIPSGTPFPLAFNCEGV